MPDNEIAIVKDNKQIINTDIIDEILASVHKEGKSVLLSEDAAQKIVEFEKIYDLVCEARELLKERAKETMIEFNTGTIKDPRAETLTISLSKPPARAFEVPDDMKYYLKKKITYVTNNDRVLDYETKHNTLPEGVIEKSRKRSISFRVKKQD